MNLPAMCVLDTNVAVNANRVSSPDEINDIEIRCVYECVKALEHIYKSSVVLDLDNEIFDEYRKNLSFEGQPGPGDAFLKWLHNNLGNPDKVMKVDLVRRGDVYVDFPVHPDLHNFDPSDKKFVAVANKHPDKPPILEATDSKWWGWKDPLREKGIKVIFLCEEYIKLKYKQKMG